MKPTSMRKLIGVNLLSEKSKLMKELTKIGCIEVVSASEMPTTIKMVENGDIDDINIKLARLAFANSFIKEQLGYAMRVSKSVKQSIVITAENGDEITKTAKKPLMSYKPTKKPFLVPKPQLDYDEFMRTDEKAVDTFKQVAKLEKLSQELTDIKAKEVKSLQRIKAVYPFRQLKQKLSRYRATRSTYIALGNLPAKREQEFSDLNEVLDSATFEILQGASAGGSKYQNISVAVVCSIGDKDAVLLALNDVGYCEVSFSHEHISAKDIITSERANIKLCKERRREIVENIIADYEPHEFTMQRRLAEDYYNIRLQMIKAETLMRQTDKCYVFEAWMPDNCEEMLDKALDGLAVTYLLRDAAEDETPPTLLNDNGMVYPYHSVTNMFSIPAHNEINPNPFVTFFFVLFFGVMISDAIYGLILTVATSIILIRMKPRKYELSMVKILFMGGISTMIWGMLFGSYLGVTLAIGGVKYYLFNPIEDPMSMLILSLGLGLMQMLTGIAVNAYALFRRRQFADAIFGALPWFLLVGGIALMFTGNTVVTYIAYGVLGVGILGLMVGGSLHKKGIKKVSAGVAKLYGLVNFFSDLMSYTRLFGLGLATGVIAFVFNTLGGVFIEMIPVVGYVLAAAVMIFGHLFNIGINTLGAYVHNSRLQFVEFFGRFYSGGGHVFIPLGSNKKYYNFTLKEEI